MRFLVLVIVVIVLQSVVTSGRGFIVGGLMGMSRSLLYIDKDLLIGIMRVFHRVEIMLDIRSLLTIRNMISICSHQASSTPSVNPSLVSILPDRCYITMAFYAPFFNLILVKKRRVAKRPTASQ